MVGNRQGALKARDTLLKKDPDHFKKLGRKGGHNSPGNIRSGEHAKQLGRQGGLAKRDKMKANKNNGNKTQP